MMGLPKIIGQINKMEIKSVTDSPFRYGLFMFLFGTFAAIFKTDAWVVIVLFSVGGLLELFALIFYTYYGIKNPDYLRSEAYQQNKQIIEMLGDKENQQNPNVGDLKYIPSPYSHQITDGIKHELGEKSQ